MKMNVVFKLIVFFTASCSFIIQHADSLTSRDYQTTIRKIEQMLDGYIPLDMQFAESNLNQLRGKVTSSHRVTRINEAARRLNRLIQDEQDRTRAREEIATVPEPKLSVPSKPKKQVQSKDKVEIVPKRPSIKGLKPSRQLKTLLLFVESLVSTVDLAIKTKQKENAAMILKQAAKTIPLMREIITKHPKLAEKYTPKVDLAQSRIEKTIEELRSME